MRIFHLSEMRGGWFIGDFEPTCLRIGAFEAACKFYRAGVAEPRHLHRIATEFTVIASGRARMNGRELTTGDIVMLEPGVSADFEVLEDTITLVVKVPSVAGDKLPVPHNEG